MTRSVCSHIWAYDCLQCHAEEQSFASSECECTCVMHNNNNKAGSSVTAAACAHEYTHVSMAYQASLVLRGEHSDYGVSPTRGFAECPGFRHPADPWSPTAAVTCMQPLI